MTTIAPETPVDASVDLSDLDLDDEHTHGVCSRCYGDKRPKHGTPVLAVCGREVLFVRRPTFCPDCTSVYEAGTCLVCGRAFEWVA